MLQVGHAALGRRSGSPRRRSATRCSVLTKRKTVSEVCRELQVSETSFNRWREQPLEAIEEAMNDKADRAEPNADLERRLAEAERTIGKLALENEFVGKSLEVVDVSTRASLGRGWRAPRRWQRWR
jgi:transposase-like protein